MDAVKDLIRPELMVLIPVLYFFGMGIKKSASIADKYIPMLLGLVGIVLATIYVMATTPLSDASSFMLALFGGITQGILCAGLSVYVNQIVKQSGKDDTN